MHYIDSIVTSNNLQNLSYNYDKFGNLEARKDNLRNLEETFHYDKMNRLTDIYLGNTHSQILYDPLGRMTSKQADGQTVFANASFAAAQGQPARPHAMKSAETAEGVFPSATQEVTYTGFDKVKTIAEGGNTLAYTYGYDQQRIRMVENIGDITRTKDYVGVCEYIAENDGENTTTKTLTYLVGPYGVFAVVEKQGNEETLHYILKDHLGSWTTITDAEGVVEQELSFDAWGNLRNPVTWNGDFSGTPMFDRGFTGHEHISAFVLINMNGRCYDPLTSSFLSVDAYVQDPTSAQAFNRYAYCGYNPLRYTDPTGWSQRPRDGNVNPNLNTGGHTTYHSDDPNDVLWGRSVHPWGNSSSGYVNGTAYTTTIYVQGNVTTGNWYKDKDGTMKYSSELKQASDLQEGQIFYGTCFVENDIYYSLVGSKYDVNSVAGQIVRKLEDGVWPNYTRYMEEVDEYLHSPYDPSNPNQCGPSQKSTDFNGILEYDNKGNNCITFKYGDAKLYFFIHKEPNAMYGRFEGWDSPTGFSRNSTKTGNHLHGGYDAHVLTWGKDSTRNAPKTGQYQQDVILLVYPSYESRENASRLVYEKYRKKH